MKVEFLGITGGAASGKTTIADVLFRNFKERISILQFDRYYRDQGHLSVEERALVNYDHPNSLDHELFVKHLDELAQGNSIQAPVYDFATHTRSTETQTIEPKELVVVDGILIMAFEEVVNRLTFKVFVDAPDNVRLQRRVKRDMSERGRTEESVNKQFVSSVLPMHKKFVQPHKDFTELVVDGLEDPNKSVTKLISFIGL